MGLISIPVIQTETWVESSTVGHGAWVVVGLFLGDISDRSMSKGKVENIVLVVLTFKRTAGDWADCGLYWRQGKYGASSKPKVPPANVSRGVEASVEEYVILLCFVGLKPTVMVATVRRWNFNGSWTWSCLHDNYLFCSDRNGISLNRDNLGDAVGPCWVSFQVGSTDIIQYHYACGGESFAHVSYLELAVGWRVPKCWWTNFGII